MITESVIEIHKNHKSRSKANAWLTGLMNQHHSHIVCTVFQSGQQQQKLHQSSGSQHLEFHCSGIVCSSPTQWGQFCQVDFAGHDGSTQGHYWQLQYFDQEPVQICWYLR